MYEVNELATLTRIPRAVLLREAVDDLVEKHRVVWSVKSDAPYEIYIPRIAPKRFITRIEVEVVVTSRPPELPLLSRMPRHS